MFPNTAEGSRKEDRRQTGLRLKVLKGPTALHRLLLTLPLVLVRFGVAAQALGVSVAAVVSVAAPEDQQDRRWFFLPDRLMRAGDRS